MNKIKINLVKNYLYQMIEFIIIFNLKIINKIMIFIKIHKILIILQF